MKALQAKSIMVAAVFVVVLVIASVAKSETANLSIELNASEVHRRLLHSKVTMDVTGDSLVLLYPKWIPGHHAPVGPIGNIATLFVEDKSGNQLSWERDWSDPYRIVVRNTQGLDGVTVKLTYLCNQPPAGVGGSSCWGFPSLALLSWNAVLLYPEGIPINEIKARASVVLPANWEYGTALPTESRTGSKIDFTPVTLEELVDMPLICGEAFRTYNLVSTNNASWHLHVVAHDPSDLPRDDSVLIPFKQLAYESEALFGGTHFDQYHILLVLSDEIPFIGLEHRNSSMNGVKRGALTDADWGNTLLPYVVPHEVTHAWCGKFRRPAGMCTDDLNQPKEMDLLWVYEGLTQYLGWVLSARAGFISESDLRERYAFYYHWWKTYRARSWRTLRDVGVANYTLNETKFYWWSLQGEKDYYTEGMFLWAEIDARIRSATDNKKSLDDFCHSFFSGHDPEVHLHPFSQADVIEELSKLVDYPWDSLISAYTQDLHDEFNESWITALGCVIDTSRDKTSVYSQFETRYEWTDCWHTLGLLVLNDGTIADVVVGTPADVAGLYPEAKIVAINGKSYSPERLERAIENSTKAKSIDLLVMYDETYSTFEVKYDGGAWFHELVPANGDSDYLTSIVTPRVGKSSESE